MASGDDPRQLAAMWKTARNGNLSPWSQAKAWGLKHAWEITHTDGQTHGRNAWIAERLHVEGSPTKHPFPQ